MVVIQNKKGRIILPSTEIISNNELFDYSAKYLGESQEITPGNVSEKSKKLIDEYLNSIYDNINLNGITRSEFIIIDDIPYILETNTIPGFTEQSIVPQQIKAQKLNVVFGLQRHYQSKYIDLKQRVDQGAIGKIRGSQVYWNDAGLWTKRRRAGQTEL